MTTQELIDKLQRSDAPEIGVFLDGVQGEGATKPRPILGLAEVDGTVLLIIGKRGET